ncbi:MAG: hypothetical protein AAF493_28400 [Pseudomonadota bacterium]
MANNEALRSDEQLALILDALKESMRAQRQIIETLGDVRAGIQALRDTPEAANDDSGVTRGDGSLKPAPADADEDTQPNDIPVLTEMVAGEPNLGDLNQLNQD